MTSMGPDAFVLTPFFIGEPLPGLADLAEDTWTINEPGFAAETRREKMNILHEEIAAFVERAVGEGRRPVSVAGDCCSSIGVLAGLQRAGISPALLWFDAHGDFNTWETTPSGFLGGMPLAMLVGRGEQTLVEAVGASGLAESAVMLTDGRDLDPLEAGALAASAVTHVTDTASLLEAPVPAGPLWVHVDTDVITAAEAPAQNYPSPGGPTAAEVAAVLAGLSATGRVEAVSLSSWNPALDADGTTASVCWAAFASLLASP